MKKPIKSYNLKFNKLIYLAIPVILIIMIPVIYSCIIHIIRMSASAEGYSSVIDIVIIILMLVITLLVLSCIFFARYVISEKTLVMRIGVFTQSIKIENITILTLVRSLNKIVVSFKSGDDLKQIAVNIDENKFDEFIETMISLNKKIIYNIDSDE